MGDNAHNRISETETEDTRQAMGHTRALVERMNLSACTPQPSLSSAGYCLANPGAEYLVYQPTDGEAFSVELKAGTYRYYQWFDPARGVAHSSGQLAAADGVRQFKIPFSGDAVLHLRIRE